MVSARLRHGGSWSDACILNISKRGLMIHTGRPVRDGAEVELRRGNHVIVARVMWRDGGRAGLHSEVPVPVEDILTLGNRPRSSSPPRQESAANSAAAKTAAACAEERSSSPAGSSLRRRSRAQDW